MKRLKLRLRKNARLNLTLDSEEKKTLLAVKTIRLRARKKLPSQLLKEVRVERMPHLMALSAK
jgi:hypothetical protein